MKTEIAGLKINYSTAPELNEKLNKALEKITARLEKIESRRKSLRVQKAQLEKFLGVKKTKETSPSPASQNTPA